jgi:hypothetical protein
MNFTQEILDMFIGVQTNFLYLWPIFNTITLQEEVKALLDSEEFDKVDKSWNRIMAEVQQDLRALSLRHIFGLAKNLKKS